jgi:glutamate-5-semialdehyde dehydrogenase
MTNPLVETCKQTKRATQSLLISDTKQKNNVLQSMSRLLSENQASIIAANQLDLEKGLAQGLSSAMLDRLTITENGIKQMQQSLADVIRLDDPLLTESPEKIRPNGIRVTKKRIPLGVILMIYESRPNVTVEAASLAIKSGNGIILRGGKEAFESNQAIAKCWYQALAENGFNENAIRVLETTERSVMNELLKLDELIDVVIPRGGEGLIRHVVANSHIPVIKHYQGICHLYVDESADLTIATNLLINGKTQRPGVCNALEGVIIHKNIAEDFLPLAKQALEEKNVTIYGCDKTRSYFPDLSEANEKTFMTEFLSLELACKLVDDFEEAIEFIDQYGSGHTEVIATNNKKNADAFIKRVDASVVMVNASSRFSDGGELGLGAEIGISTSKIHAYGPMGLESLTSEKFVVIGEGQVRE